MPTISLTTQQAAGEITRSGHQWALDNGKIYFDFRDSMVFGTMPFGTGDFTRFTAQQIAATRNAFKAWSDIANIEFVENSPNNYSNSGWILLGNYGTTNNPNSPGFANFPDDTVEAQFDINSAGDIWISSSHPSNASNNIENIYGSYGYEVLVHEIGHALGLQHPGNYNSDPGANPTYDADATYIEDTTQYSIMSYFGEGNTGANFGSANLAAPMMDDIAAIQKIYGANNSAFNGNTTYGFNSNTNREWYTATGSADPLIFCIWDTGGKDTIDLSGYINDQTLDLRSGRFTFSSVGGLTKNLSIYDGVVIENGIGGSGKDTIIGNAVANIIGGRAGDDELKGNSGADNLSGGADADTLWGGDGNDTETGDAGDDVINGESGNDTLSGGEDKDAVNGGTGADLLGGDGGEDTLNGNEGMDTINGGAGNDTINGNEEADLLNGGTDADVIAGNIGADIINGDEGIDVLNGNEGMDTISGGAGNDTINGNEEADLLNGGTENDEIYGNLGADIINGDEGTDKLFGGDDGDTLHGNAGNDTMAGNTGDDSLFGDGNSDTVDGDEGQDTLDGGDGGDAINGGIGNDSILGGAGEDTLYGHEGDDEIHGGLDGDKIFGGLTNIFGVSFDAVGKDILYGDKGNDSISGEDGDDTLYGGDDNDTLNGDGGADRLDGGAGSDLLNGGAGDDTYLYRGDEVMSSEGLTGGTDLVEVYANLLAGVTTTNIENFTVKVESGLTVIANGLANILTGGDGGDTLDGAGGIDHIHGGGGADNITGGAQADVMDGQGGGDTYDYDGSDTITDTGASGTDHVKTAVTAVMGALFSGVENITATGTSDINLTGDNNANVLTGNGGVNSLDGKGGNDSLLGGGGFDTLLGGEGSDTLKGEEGNDLLRGGAFDSATDVGDSIWGGAGGDTIYGALGNDTLYGDSGADSINGDAGDDSIDGGISNEADILIGGIGNDTINGGAGGDLVDGGSGNNLLSGGEGDDTVSFSDSGLSSVDGGAGADVLKFDWTTVPATDGVRYASHTPDIGSGHMRTYSSAIGNYTSSVEYTSFERFDLTGTSVGDDLRGDKLNDTLKGFTGDDSLTSYGGIDMINGGEGNDTLWSGSWSGQTKNLDFDNSDGLVTFADGTSINSVQAFRDLELGSGNDNVVFINSFNDSATLGGGNDTIDIGQGFDTMVGGDGTDVLKYDWSIVSATSGVFYDSHAPDTGSGNMRTYSSATGNYTARVIYSEFERFDLTGTAVGDDLRGGSLNDTLNGFTGDDALTSYGGIDIINGGTGNDTLLSGLWSGQTEHLDFDNSDGRVTFTDGTSITNIQAFRDLQLGSGNDNVVFVNAFDDSAALGGGNDTIDIGRGFDTVSGGDGTDVLKYDWSAVLANSGVSYDSHTPGTGSGNMRTYSSAIGNYTSRVEYANFERFDLTGTIVGDDLRGDTLNDTLKGLTGDDWLTSYGGVDTINGGAGNDTLWSGLWSGQTEHLDFDNSDGRVTFADGTSITGVEAFRDLQLGSGKDNVVFIGNFSDSANLGGGNDTINIGQGFDTVDGGSGIDVLEYDWSAVPANAGVSYDTHTPGTGSGIMRTYSSAIGSSTSLVEYANFERFDLTGTAVSDDLRGHTFNDTLNGFTGDDALTSGGGSDLIDGGEGVDRLNDGLWSGLAANQDFDNTDNLVVLSNGTRIANIEAFSNLQLGAGADKVVFTGSFNDSADLGSGNDTIDIGQGFDAVNGGDGTDVLKYDWSAVPANAGVYYDDHTPGTGSGNMRTYSSGIGNYTSRVEYTDFERFDLTGTIVGDDLRGDTLNDTLNGFSGDDWLTSYGGIDTINGGTGNDTLWSGLWSGQSEHLDFDNSDGRVTFADGTSITSVEAFRDLQLGSGKDNVVFIGNFSDSANLGGGNDTINIGQGFDTVDGGSGIDVLKYDWSAVPANSGVSYDSHTPGTGSGNVRTYSSAIGNFTSRVEYANFERFDLTGTSVGDDLRGAALSDTLLGMAGADVLTGGDGNDTLDGGADQDRMIGGKGNDSYVVADSGDVIEEILGEGTDAVSATATYTLDANVENLLLTGNAAINGTGNSAANKLTGNSAGNQLTGDLGKDTLTGGAGNDTLNGASTAAPFGKGEIDRLTGGTGKDTFVLGIAAAVLYNDGLAANAGRADYALITDFTVGQDKLQLQGVAGQYYLGAHGINNLAGTGLWLEQGANDELIAVLRSGDATALTPGNTISSASYV